MSERHEKVKEVLKHLAANFIEREADRTSLITVTRTDLSPDFGSSTIYISVLPDSKAEDALHFCQRKMTDFKKYVKENLKMRAIPFFDVALDAGEKNRQRIEELSHEK
jgi:ribosome-binding factor A